MIKLTTPTGVIYLRKDSVVAAAENDRSTVVKTNLWLANTEEPFNILEDVETVRALLN